MWSKEMVEKKWRAEIKEKQTLLEATRKERWDAAIECRNIYYKECTIRTRIKNILIVKKHLIDKAKKDVKEVTTQKKELVEGKDRAQFNWMTKLRKKNAKVWPNASNAPKNIPKYTGQLINKELHTRQKY